MLEELRGIFVSSTLRYRNQYDSHVRKTIHGLRCRLSKQHISRQDTGEVSTTRDRQKRTIIQIVPTPMCGGITVDFEGPQ